MASQDDLPSPRDLLQALLGFSHGCPHERALGNVALLLTAAAMRHGDRLEFTREELEEASARLLAIHPQTLSEVVVVEALLNKDAPAKAPTHDAPGGLQ